MRNIKMEDLEKELINFLKHIITVHTDQYGHLEICNEEDVVKEYLKIPVANIKKCGYIGRCIHAHIKKGVIVCNTTGECVYKIER